jgi:hypothetical protein
VRLNGLETETLQVCPFGWNAAVQVRILLEMQTSLDYRLLCCEGTLLAGLPGSVLVCLLPFFVIIASLYTKDMELSTSFATTPICGVMYYEN